MAKIHKGSLFMNRSTSEESTIKNSTLMKMLSNDTDTDYETRLREESDLFERHLDEEYDEESEMNYYDLKRSLMRNRSRKQQLESITRDDSFTVYESTLEDLLEEVDEDAKKKNLHLLKKLSKDKTPLYLLNPDNFQHDEHKQCQIRRAIVTYRHHQERKGLLNKLIEDNRKYKAAIALYKQREERIIKECGCKKSFEIIMLTTDPQTLLTPTPLVLNYLPPIPMTLKQKEKQSMEHQNGVTSSAVTPQRKTVSDDNYHGKAPKPQNPITFNNSNSRMLQTRQPIRYMNTSLALQHGKESRTTSTALSKKSLENSLAPTKRRIKKILEYQRNLQQQQRVRKPILNSSSYTSSPSTSQCSSPQSREYDKNDEDNFNIIEIKHEVVLLDETEDTDDFKFANISQVANSCQDTFQAEESGENHFKYHNVKTPSLIETSNSHSRAEMKKYLDERLKFKLNLNRNPSICSVTNLAKFSTDAAYENQKPSPATSSPNPQQEDKINPPAPAAAEKASISSRNSFNGDKNECFKIPKSKQPSKKDVDAVNVNVNSEASLSKNTTSSYESTKAAPFVSSNNDRKNENDGAMEYEDFPKFTKGKSSSPPKIPNGATEIPSTIITTKDIVQQLPSSTSCAVSPKGKGKRSTPITQTIISPPTTIQRKSKRTAAIFRPNTADLLKGIVTTASNSSRSRKNIPPSAPPPPPSSASSDCKSNLSVDSWSFEEFEKETVPNKIARR